MAGILVSLVLLAPGGVRGQAAWDTPMLVAPTNPSGPGVFLLDTSPGSGIGVLGVWRPGDGVGGVGYRLGLGEGRRGRIAVLGGVDVSGTLLRESEDFPMDMVWVTGVGGGAGHGILLSAPLGVSVGRWFEVDDVAFNPFVSPRVVLDAHFGGDLPGDPEGLSLGVAVDLGVDVRFHPYWTIRFGATMGDRSGVAIGLLFPGAW